MTTIVDQRDQGGAGASNRERFINRVKGHAKKAVDRAISEGNITDLGKDGVDVVVPKGGLSEPRIHHGQGGISERALPGNKEFMTGDRLKKPSGGGGGGKKPGPGEPGSDGEGDDDFVFHLSEEEFLNLLFDDLELPNQIKQGAEDASQTDPVRAGYSSTGPYNKLDLVQSRRKKMQRVLATGKTAGDEIIDLLNEEIDIYSQYSRDEKPSNADFSQMSTRQKIHHLATHISQLKEEFADAVSDDDREQLSEMDKKIHNLSEKRRIMNTWRESTDLRFRYDDAKPRKVSKAVAVYIMDTSGSMDQQKKDLAKIFFFMLLRFLQRNHTKTEVVFIRHHTIAQEVDEQKFFYDTGTGGTLVSSGLKKALEVIAERYPENEYNIYVAQGSDGDNFSSDKEDTITALKSLLNIAQGFFYMEIKPQVSHGYEDSLHPVYDPIKAEYKDSFWTGTVRQRKDIWPLFREFFQKRTAYTPGMGVKASAAFAPT